MTHISTSDQLKLQAKAVHEATYGSKPKHTPEPWLKSDGNSLEVRVIAGNKRIADFKSFDLKTSDKVNGQTIYCTDPTTAERDANIDRVLSCINALAGIPDPAKFVEKAKKDEKKVVLLSHELDEMYEAVTYCLDNNILFKSVREAVDKYQAEDDGNDPADQADFANKLKKEN